MPGAAAEPRTGRTGGALAGRPAHRRAQPQEPDEAGARRHSAAGDPRAQEAPLRRADLRLAEATPAAHPAPPAVQAAGPAARPVILAADRGDPGPPLREQRRPHRPYHSPSQPG